MTPTITPEAARLAEEAKRWLSDILDATYSDHSEQYERQAKCVAAIDALLALVQPAVSEEATGTAWIPRNASDVRDFLGSHCISMTYGEPSEPTIASDNDLYELTAHDLLSAFVWAGHFDHELAARAQSSSKGDEGMQHD